MMDISRGTIIYTDDYGEDTLIALGTPGTSGSFEALAPGGSVITCNVGEVIGHPVWALR